MIKIFLTGDNHIGMRYESHERAAELASARIEAFRGMVSRANDEGCGLFAIAGDLFHNTSGVARKDVARVTELLGGFCGTVLILPGNHDYYDANAVPAVWRDFREASKGLTNLLLLTEHRPYELDVGDDRVVVYPAGCGSRHSGENALGWMRGLSIEPDAAYRIGMAHGALEGESLDREGRYFPMTREELNAIPVDVWLLGHAHVPFPGGLYERKYTSAGNILNAGTHVQTDMSCNTDGECFIIEVGGTGQKRVRARKFVSGPVRFYRRSVLVTPGTMERKLQRELARLPDSSVVDLALSGMADPEEYANRARIVEGALARFIEGACDDGGLSRRLTRDLIASEFPETSFSARFLTALLDDPREAQMAYDLLKGSME